MAAPKILHEKMDLVDKLLLQMSEFGQMLERNPNKRSVTYTGECFSGLCIKQRNLKKLGHILVINECTVFLSLPSLHLHYHIS
jgi:hypothetical protein